MAANWWEIGKPVDEVNPAEDKDRNWWELGQVEEPAAQPDMAVRPAEPAPVAEPRPAAPRGPVGLGVLDLLTAPFSREQDPRLGAMARGAELLGSGLEATSRLTGLLPETTAAPLQPLGVIKEVAPQLQEWADSFRNWGKEINYEPSTQLGDIAENPLQAVPFIIERVIQSSPDMAAATVALPAYIPALANDILNQRLENDNKTIEQATIGDVAAATAAAAIQGPLERFATRRLGEPGSVLGQTAFQAGTEAVQETGQYAAETLGTEVGFDPRVAGLVGLEAAIVGGTLGAAAGATNAVERNAILRDIENRFRAGEDVRSQEEVAQINRLRDQALQDAKAIAAPELPELQLEEGQTEPTPLQYGDVYAQKVFDSVGQYIPANAEFKVEEKVVDGARRFVVTDKEGIQYGQTLQDQNQAKSFVDSLNNTSRARAEVLKQLEPLQSSLTSVLKGYGLNDIGLNLNKRVFTRRGEALTSEGLFDPVVRQVFLAVDAVDPQGTLDTNQRREALRGVLRHEVVHALRYLDLWKKSEWKNLEKTVSRIQKPGTNKTYLQVAQEAYRDQSPVIQVEEGVADLIRDVAGNLSRVAGKPRSLSERAINFFDRAKNALTGSGFQTYEDIVARFERGDIGARERGRIRTFRSTEEQLAERGQVPERIQRLLKTPVGRNQFREQTVQQFQPNVPDFAPARNSVRLTGLRESRSTIDPVPPTIKVDEQDFPTRDSEGRLIYSGYEGPEVFGIQTAPTQQGLRNFWNWFRNSKTVDNRDRPIVFYHGTAADIAEFRPKQAGSVFISRSPEFAESFAGLSSEYMIRNFTDFMSDQEVLNVLNESMRSSTTPKFYDKLEKIQKRVSNLVGRGKALDAKAIADIKELYSDSTGGLSNKMVDSIRKRLPSSSNIVPVYVKAENTWDYENKDHIRAVLKKVRSKYGGDIDLGPSTIEFLNQGDWRTVEGTEGNSPFLDAIRELGFDSMYVEESGYKNLAVFDPNQIKSAVGNNGNFDITTPSIRESRVRNPQIDTPQFQRFFKDSKVVDEANQPLVVYHGTDREIDAFKASRDGGALGTGIYFSPSAEFAGQYAQREGGNVVPAYVSLKNPLIIDGSLSQDPMIEALMRLGVPQNRANSIVERAYDIKGYITTEVKSRAEKEGFDGILQYKNGQLGEIVAFRPNQIKSAVGNVGAFDIYAPSIRESRVQRAPKSQVFFEVAPDPNNQELTNAWRGLNPQLRLDISERVAQQMIPSVLSAVRSNGNVVNQVGSYLDDTNPSFALMVQSGNPLEISKAIGFVLSQDSMMVVSLTPFKGGDLVPAISINIGNKTPQEVEAIYNSLREIEVDGNKPVGGQTFANGHMTILNYSNVQTDQLADLIDKKLNGQYNVLSRDVYSAFPEKKDYDYASPQDDGSGSRADLRQRLRGLRAEASGLVEREVGVESQRAGDRGRRDQGRVIAPLEGAPNVQGGGPIPEIVSVAEQYAAQKGLPYQRQPSYVEVDEARAKRIADAFEAMKHDPKNPAVAEAYQDLIKQTRDQYDALINAGYNFTFFDSATDPYAGNPWNAMRDLRDNKRMAVYGTYDGYGTAGITDTELENNPLLADTGLRWPDQNGVERMVTANDLFRAVHDAFGHGIEGAGFRARGEENAWQAHARLFTGPALAALTTETRGQNSWLNYGPYGEKNRTARVEDTVFAEQKIGLLPNWTWQEGLETVVAPRARESRRPGEVPLGPRQPGPATDTDNTGAADALNMGQPIDSMGIPTGPQLTSTMPDGTVDISRARLEPLTRRLIRGVEFIQSAPDKLRGGVGLGDLAGRIEGYYDTYASRLGQVNTIIRDGFNKIDFRGKDAALETFERYMRARENKRTEEMAEILRSATESEKSLIDSWNEISRVTKDVNLNVRTPEGEPMKVWDSKVGAWRPIRAVIDFFPRTLRKEVLEVMKNPDVDPALYQDLLSSLVESGRAANLNEAEEYLVREWFSDEVKQDYFAGVEKARTDPLPEIFYDYSWDAATRYLRKWARRTSQIEYFGQELGEFKKEWFGTNIPKVRDEETQAYLNEIKNRIYEVEPFDAITNITSWLNSIATATQLGNPISASLNLLGGTISNVQEFGIRQVAKSYAELILDWGSVQKEGTTLGILNTDVLNILNDHVEKDSQKYFAQEEKISAALAKFANATLTVGGFNGAENIVRASAMLAAMGRLNDYLRQVNTNPNSAKVKSFQNWVKRENLDIDKILLENGSGPETAKYLRRAVNVPQGSYKIDMTPVFIDQPIGRFLFKYQKFGTQINRFFYRHFFNPFMKDPTPKNFLRMAGFVGSAVIGGGAILAIREAFGYGDPGPDDEEIKKALENEDTARAWGLIMSRAWQNIMAAGSFGFVGNYVQFGLDWQDQQRVKNPMSPPGLASIDAVVDLFNRIRDQKGLNARDFDEIAETNLSLYRAYKRIGLAGLDTIGSDAREVKRFVAQRDLREIREFGRRYSEEMEIEFKRSTSPGSPIRTEMTPTNKAITDALHQGDSARARVLLNAALKGKTVKEREKVRQSVRAAIRNRQPIQVGGSAPSSKDKMAFMKWARENLPAESYQKIRRADRQYRVAAARMGMGFGE